MVSDFKKKKKTHAFISLLIALGALVLLALIIVLIVSTVTIYRKKEKLNTQIENLNNRIADLSSQNDHLEKGISNSDDAMYIEKVAREELDLQKEGEKIISFVFPPEPEEKNTQAPQTGWQWVAGAWQWIKSQF